ncbi:MAG: right-handed parallel beta-helix repeat-containing protein [Fibrobacterota bacterium]|nr:right-handed parallel beta-helix repeat-containing protein [Fibrobacterota bacterium]
MFQYQSILILSAALASFYDSSFARILDVGPGKTYAKPSAAAAVVKDGDTITITPGVYSGDVAIWPADNLLLMGTAKYAHIKANGAHAAGKGSWVIQGNNCRVRSIEFSEARVPDQNGAGIRLEGNGITISDCYFHHNENGILTGGGSGEIIIEYSEFAENGFGDGQSHNMYIGNVASFILQFCYTHHAKIGHNIKTRALENRILYNNSSGGTTGTSSYELDMPNGGFAYVIGNVFQQGDATDNPTLLAYGAEGLKNPGKELYVINNTFVNDRTNGATFIDIAGGTTAKVRNNLIVGAGRLLSGTADTSGNVSTTAPAFVNKATGDYRLTAGSPAIDKGKDPGSAGTVNLAPTMQYLHPANAEKRPVKGALDAGAFEFGGSASVLRPRRGMNAPARPRKGGAWMFRFGFGAGLTGFWNAAGLWEDPG